MFLVMSSAPPHLPVCEWPDELHANGSFCVVQLLCPPWWAGGTPWPGNIETYLPVVEECPGISWQWASDALLQLLQLPLGMQGQVCPLSWAVPMLLCWPDSQLSLGNFPSLRLHPAQFSGVGEVLPRANPYSGLLFERAAPAVAVNSVFLAAKSKKYFMRNN